jgi:hypothetical protein
VPSAARAERDSPPSCTDSLDNRGSKLAPQNGHTDSSTRTWRKQVEQGFSCIVRGGYHPRNLNVSCPGKLLGSPKP